MAACTHPRQKCHVSIGPIIVIVTCQCGEIHAGERYGICGGPVVRFPLWADTAYLLAVLEHIPEETL